MLPLHFNKIKQTILAHPDNCDNFNCGETPIDDFVHYEALEYQNERLGVSYVFKYHNKIIGFVTLSMADLRVKELNAVDRLGIGNENYPALQISQLGVHEHFHDNDLGTFLCTFCLAKAYSYSETVGCRFLVLNAKRSAVKFYEKFGFRLLPHQNNRREPVMYLNIFSKQHVTV